MSVEMEVLVCDLLEELREEPGALDLTESAAAQAALLQRACVELRFVERHAQQAVAIVLGRSSVNAPNVLAECLAGCASTCPSTSCCCNPASCGRGRRAEPSAGGGGARRAAAPWAGANSAASLGAPLDEDDDWTTCRRSRNCERCTLLNADATVCRVRFRPVAAAAAAAHRRAARGGGAGAACRPVRSKRSGCASSASSAARWQGAGADGGTEAALAIWLRELLHKLELGPPPLRRPPADAAEAGRSRRPRRGGARDGMDLGPRRGRARAAC